MKYLLAGMELNYAGHTPKGSAEMQSGVVASVHKSVLQHTVGINRAERVLRPEDWTEDSAYEAGFFARVARVEAGGPVTNNDFSYYASILPESLKEPGMHAKRYAFIKGWKDGAE